jgi:hypothetical protein
VLRPGFLASLSSAASSPDFLMIAVKIRGKSAIWMFVRFYLLTIMVIN